MNENQAYAEWVKEVDSDERPRWVYIADAGPDISLMMRAAFRGGAEWRAQAVPPIDDAKAIVYRMEQYMADHEGYDDFRYSINGLVRALTAALSAEVKK